MASSPFERQVVDADTNEDRTSGSSRASETPRQYDPSPSFLDHDRPSMRLVELPAWLQSFASSVGEPSEPEAPAQPAPDPDQQPALELSGEPDATNAPGQPMTRSSSSRGVGENFISEDDLPEWLRSIAPEDPAESVAESLVFDQSAKGDNVSVPTVSRAWSTSKDARGVDEATSLFALVASQTPQAPIPAQDAERSGRDGSAQPGRGMDAGRVEGYGSARPPGAQPVIEMPRTSESSEAGSEIKPSLPIVPIAVAVILLIVLVGAALGLFIL